MRTKQLNNRGFSLIEVLLSIAILAIIIVPLFNNFITSNKVQRNTKILSTVESTSVSLLETLKNQEIATILSQYNIAHDETKFNEFVFLPLNEGAKTNRIKDIPSPTGTAEDYTGAYTDTSSDGKYYLCIDNIQIGGIYYDILVNIDTAQNYKTTLNAYKLPVLMELNPDSVVMIDTMKEIGSETVDELALKQFVRWNKEYVARMNLQEQMNENAVKAAQAAWEAQKESGVSVGDKPADYMKIPYAEHGEGNIQSHMEKQTVISITPTGTGNDCSVVANAIYTIDPSELTIDGSLTERQTCTINLYNKTYNTSRSYLFIYYTPSEKCNSGSVKTEEIRIDNNQTDTTMVSGMEKTNCHTMNVYLMKQTDAVSTYTKEFCKLINGKGPQGTDEPQPIELFTNMSNEGAKPQFCVDGFSSSYSVSTIEREQDAKDWIYHINISVYKHQDSVSEKYKAQDVIYTISSTGTNE